MTEKCRHKWEPSKHYENAKVCKDCRLMILTIRAEVRRAKWHSQY